MGWYVPLVFMLTSLPADDEGNASDNLTDTTVSLPNATVRVPCRPLLLSNVRGRAPALQVVAKQGGRENPGLPAGGTR